MSPATCLCILFVMMVVDWAMNYMLQKRLKTQCDDLQKHYKMTAQALGIIENALGVRKKGKFEITNGDS